jgi:hypothetical protein
MSQIHKPTEHDFRIFAARRVTMRLLCVLLLPTAFAITVNGQPTASTADLAFMTGCWKFERSGRLVEEHWLAPAGGSLMGVSRTVAGGKTVEYEFLQIRDLPEGLTYIATPANQPEARFKMASKTSDEIVFENPTHDFPQRIRYRREGEALHARIEGTTNGKARGIDFPYQRAACTP